MTVVLNQRREPRQQKNDETENKQKSIRHLAARSFSTATFLLRWISAQSAEITLACRLSD
jgi:hypothetical protein